MRKLILSAALLSITTIASAQIDAPEAKTPKQETEQMQKGARKQDGSKAEHRHNALKGENRKSDGERRKHDQLKSEHRKQDGERRKHDALKSENLKQKGEPRKHDALKGEPKSETARGEQAKPAA